MPFRKLIRKRTFRRRVVRRPLMRLKRPVIRRSNRLRSNLHLFKRWSNNVSIQVPALGPSVTVNNNGTGLFITPGSQTMNCSVYFRLQDLPANSEFVNLFDFYMIKAVSLNIQYIHNVSEASTTGSVGMPTMYVVRDYDDPVPVDIPNLMQYGNCQRIPFTASSPMRRIYLRPTIRVSGDDLQFKGKQRQPWIDCAVADKEHYGVKLGFDVPYAGTVVPSTVEFRLSVHYYLMFKNPR